MPGRASICMPAACPVSQGRGGKQAPATNFAFIGKFQAKVEVVYSTVTESLDHLDVDQWVKI